MKYLAIDYGLKHIGLAISEGIFAEPWDQLTVTSLDHTIATLVELCRRYGIETVVVGISENEMAELTRTFADRLAESVDIPVVFYDETLSSQLASEYLTQGAASKKKRQTKQHQTAAAVILQNYLDEKNDR